MIGSNSSPTDRVSSSPHRRTDGVITRLRASSRFFEIPSEMNTAGGSASPGLLDPRSGSVDNGGGDTETVDLATGTGPVTAVTGRGREYCAGRGEGPGRACRLP